MVANHSSKKYNNKKLLGNRNISFNVKIRVRSNDCTSMC